MHNTRSNGFTMIECLVALLILAMGLGIGLGAIISGRAALELVALQSQLDEQLDQLHEAMRARVIDLEKLTRLQTATIEGTTFRVLSLPEADTGAENAPRTSEGAVIPSLSAQVEVTEFSDLFEVEFKATGRRGRFTRVRTLTTRFFEPGLSALLATESSL